MVEISAEQTAKAELLAIVVMSDKTEKPIEKSSVYTLFDMYNSEDVDGLKRVYLDRIKNEDASEIERLCSALLHLSQNAKAEFLRDCWYVAVCDSELIHEEREVIQKIASYLGVSKSDSELALKSVG